MQALKQETVVLANTPRYVLLQGNQRLGPRLIRQNSPVECDFIYGFSSKQLYDQFQLHSNLALTPYPLVIQYLQDQIANGSNQGHAIVLDAISPLDSNLFAATVQEVLNAVESKLTQVVVTHCLELDQETQAYRVQASSLSVQS